MGFSGMRVSSRQRAPVQKNGVLYRPAKESKKYAAQRTSDTLLKKKT